MSSINYFSKVVADVEYKHVSAESLMGLYRLVFHLEFVPKNWNDNYIPFLTDLRAAVKLNGTAVGIAFPTAEDFLPSVQPKSSNSTPVQRSFALDIDLRTLDRIDRERKEQGVTFEMEVLGTATVHSLLREGEAERTHPSFFPSPLRIEPLLFEPYLAKADIYCRISQNDWVELLGRMGYTRILLYEIPWPIVDEDTLQKAISHFERSRELFLSSDYKGAVAELRDSLNSACDEIGCERFQWSEVATKESRENMPLQGRFLLAWNSVRHLTHAAHHGENYSREEARYILGMGALALSLAASTPGLLQRAGESTGSGL